MKSVICLIFSFPIIIVGDDQLTAVVAGNLLRISCLRQKLYNYLHLLIICSNGSGCNIPHMQNVTLQGVFGIKSTSHEKSYKIDYHYLHLYAYSKKTKQVTMDFSITNL